MSNKSTDTRPLFFLLAACALSIGLFPQKAPAQSPEPPSPPIFETFESEPQLSLFPRIGYAQPTPEGTQEHQIWKELIFHLQRMSGPSREQGVDESVAFSIRGLKEAADVGFFSPLAVTPGATYQLNLSFRGSPGASEKSGIAILEFDEFLWYAEQYTNPILDAHFLDFAKVLPFPEAPDWVMLQTTFAVSDRTKMIHLYCFREGEDVREPFFIDNISIIPLEPKSPMEPSNR